MATGTCVRLWLDRTSHSLVSLMGGVRLKILVGLVTVLGLKDDY